MASNDIIYKELDLFRNTFGVDLRALMKDVTANIANGYPIEKAVEAAMVAQGTSAKADALLSDMVLATVRATAPLPPQAYKRADFWLEKNLLLSSALHGQMGPQMQAAITASLKHSMNLNKSWTDTARDLYKGYGRGGVIAPPDTTPAIFKALELAARKALVGSPADLKAYQRELRRSQRYVDRLAANNAPTGQLKAAYQRFINATDKFSANAMKRALNVACQEKARYVAERIARTEISRAWGEAYLKAGREDDDVIAFQWKLGSRHPAVDICDFHANANLYGLGKGIYPKRVYPSRPAHPHCGCNIKYIYAGQLDADEAAENFRIASAAFNPAGANPYIRGLSERDRIAMFGKNGNFMLKSGGNWQKYLNNWTPHVPAANYTPQTPPQPQIQPTSIGKVATQANVPAQTVDMNKRPPYSYFNDATKAQEWARKWLPINYINYGKYPADLADRVTEMLAELYTRYPEMAGRTKFLSTAQERNREFKAAYPYKSTKRVTFNTVAQSTGNWWKEWEGIGFNEARLTKYAELKAILIRDVKSGWQPVGTENVASVLTHEYGHQIDNFLIANSERAAIDKLYDDWKQSTKKNKDWGATLSQYADTNTSEFMAEAFSEYIHNPNPRPVAAAVGAEIEKAFERIRTRGAKV